MFRKTSKSQQENIKPACKRFQIFETRVFDLNFLEQPLPLFCKALHQSGTTFQLSKLHSSQQTQIYLSK